MSFQSTIRPGSRNRGVAIIIVLGLMAVMMISGAAFTIFTQIERRGSSNYRHTRQARHVLWAALACAIDDINKELDGGSGNIIYPTNYIFSSKMTGSTASAALFNSTIDDFLPSAATWDQITNANASWKLISSSSGQGYGRYAFVAWNCSGLLDANMVGLSNRTSGANAEEINLTATNFPTHGTPPYRLWRNLAECQTFFRNSLNSAYRYETYAELKHLVQNSPENCWLYDKTMSPVDFAVYSLAPMGQSLNAQNEIEDQIYVGGPETSWGDVEAGFKKAFDGVAEPELTRYSQYAALNLADFVDANDEPSVDGNNAIVGVEMVPMINEVILRYDLRYTDNGSGERTIDQDKTKIRLEVEWWYPFIKKSDGTYDLQCDIAVTNRSGNTAGTMDKTIPRLREKWHVTKPTFIEGVTAREMGRQVIGEWNANGGQVAAGVSNLNVRFDVRVGLRIVQAAGRKAIVDEVPSPYPKSDKDFWKSQYTVNLGIDLAGIGPSSATLSVTNSAQAEDPRFNHNAYRADGYWIYGSVATPGETNANAFAYLAEPANDSDGDFDMYVANRPLRTIGELGFVCYDKWRTVRLYTHNPAPPAPITPYDKVYDAFSLYKPGTYRRGLVNGNTTNQSVLASVFWQAPENEFEQSNSNRVDSNTAMDIAAEIIASANRPYRNISQIAAGVDWANYTTGATEIEREGLIRSSMDLLTTRHNLFTIVIAGEAYSEMIGSSYTHSGGRTLSSARGIAEVWRDPFPLTNGVHRCFVRYFKMIND